MANVSNLDFMKRRAKGISSQFGRNCEVVIQDLSSGYVDYPIIFIENGHVTHRTNSYGPSRIVLDALQHASSGVEDKLNYITRTQDGKMLKSSTMYIRDDENIPIAIFSINYDITEITIASNCVGFLISHKDEIQNANKIPQNVNQLLHDLLGESVKK